MMNLFLTKPIKNKRGISIVELAVVVAIISILGSIAIPSYKIHRQKTQKVAYRTDLLSLKKAWNSFATDFGSYCIKKTPPYLASIVGVGMKPLFYSPLYGHEGEIDAHCDSGDLRPDGCDPSVFGDCTHCSDFTGKFRAGRPARSTQQNLSTHSFIGFTNTGSGTLCQTRLHEENVHVQGKIANTLTQGDSECQLHDGSYKMGVYGSIGGARYYGVSVNHQGALSPEYEGTPNSPNLAQSNCSEI